MAIPSSALVLGWAGLLPFAALASALWLRLPLPVAADEALLAYGAVILSFMGGVQWGVTLRAPDGSERDWGGYAASVIPALVGWASVLVGGRLAFGILAAAFAALLAYDLRTVRAGDAPAWYGPLRTQLTAGFVVLLGVAAWAAG